MKELTLEACKDVKITDLYMGLVYFRESSNEQYASSVKKDRDNERKNFLDEMKSTMSEANYPEDTSEKMMDLLSGVYDFFRDNLAEMVNPMFLLKKDGVLYNLNGYYEGEVVDDPESAIRIESLVPLSEYYSENEYRFVICNGKVCLDVDSAEPFEKWKTSALQGIDILSKK